MSMLVVMHRNVWFYPVSMDEQEKKPSEIDFDALSKELGFNALDGDAVQMYELYQSLIKAGFKDKQALYLVGIIVAESVADEVVAFFPDEDEDSEES